MGVLIVVFVAFVLSVKIAVVLIERTRTRRLMDQRLQLIAVHLNSGQPFRSEIRALRQFAR